jgi:hypothetical protein
MSSYIAAFVFHSTCSSQIVLYLSCNQRLLAELFTLSVQRITRHEIVWIIILVFYEVYAIRTHGQLSVSYKGFLGGETPEQYELMHFNI